MDSLSQLWISDDIFESMDLKTIAKYIKDHPRASQSAIESLRHRNLGEAFFKECYPVEGPLVAELLLQDGFVPDNKVDLLWTARVNDHTKVFELLLKTVTKTISFLGGQLMDATAWGNTDTIKIILDNIDSLKDLKDTRYKQFFLDSALLQVLAYGANLDPRKQSAFYANAELLISRGASVDQVEVDISTEKFLNKSLFILIMEWTDPTDILGLLLSKGLKVTGLGKYKRQTILHQVVKKGILDEEQFRILVKSLVEHGVDINSATLKNKTPLHTLARRGISGHARIYIEHGGQVDARTLNGTTPLHLAVKGKYAGLVKLLLDQGADVNAQNQEGKAPLHLAVEGNLSLKTLQVLVRDPNVKLDIADNERVTPLSMAVAGLQSPEAVELLLKSSEECETPIVNAPIPGEGDFCPIHLAFIPMAEQTPHLCAWDDEFLWMLESLLQSKADVNLDSAMGTPLDIATRGKLDKRFIEVLQKHNAMTSIELPGPSGEN